MDEQALNKKLAEGVFTREQCDLRSPCEGGHFIAEDGTVFYGIYELPDFPNDLSACFKWLVPKAIDKIMAEHDCSSDFAYAILFKKWLQELELIIPQASLAFCLAIEKLIDQKT